MGVETGIEWCDHTFNPWWGCTHDGPECDNCYAEAFAKRTGNPVWGHDAPRRFFTAKHWAEPLGWDKQAAADGVKRRVFCASMADVGERLTGNTGLQMDAARAQLAELITRTPNLVWLLLTKRPQNIPYLFPQWADALPPNVWIGTTAGNQEGVDKRVKYLLRIPAALHFLSVEPMLGPVDLRKYLNVGGICECEHDAPKSERCEGRGRKGWIRCIHGMRFLRWVICGGESGAGARGFDPAWARSLRDQCAAQLGFGTTPMPCAFFMKQMGAKRLSASGELLTIKHRKGGDVLEWPEDLRVRQFPEDLRARPKAPSDSELRRKVSKARAENKLGRKA